MPDVSVIMLTYNREEFLERSIKAILNQTFRDFEYIIVDNGSTDNSGKLCDDWEKKDKRIKVIHKKRGSIGSGRNEGLNVVTGKYITFVDDDDQFEKDMLEFLYRLIKKYDADISICGSYREDINGITPKYVYQDEKVYGKADAVYELLKRRYYNTGMPTKLLKRDKFLDIRFLEDGIYDDISTCYKYFAHADKVVINGEPKYYCYRHIGNNSAFTTNDELLTKEQIQIYLNAYKERTRYLSHILPEETSYYRYTEWSYMISMCHKLLFSHNVKCADIYREMKQAILENIDEIEHSQYTEGFEKQWIIEIRKNTL